MKFLKKRSLKVVFKITFYKKIFFFVLGKNFAASCMYKFEKAKNYSRSFLENKVVKNKYDNNYNIGFAILGHERPEYLNACIESLYKTDIIGIQITFYLFDDGSFSEKVKEILNLKEPSNFKVKRFFFKKGPNNAGAAINRAVEYMLKDDDFDIVGWADPDCIFHPLWLKKTLEIYLWAKHNHKFHKIGPITSFNSSDIKYHKLLGVYKSPYGSYCIKRQAGMLNYLMFKEDWLKFGPFVENGSDEILLTKKLEKNGFRNITTYNSYVEHIGQDSILNLWRPTKVKRAVYGLNLIRFGWPNSIKEHETMGYFKRVKKSTTTGLNISSNLKIDVFITAIKRDSTVLMMAIEGIKRNLKHPIGNISVIIPHCNEMTHLCNKLNVKYIYENDLLPLTPKDINYTYNGLDRSGWLYQQLLKYAICNNTILDNYLVIDADTVLVQPQVYEYNDRNLILISDELHLPYFNTFKKLTGLKVVSLFSSVCHSMLFNVFTLKEMLNHIEFYTNMRWWEAIINFTDKNSHAGFSEYETYAQWCFNKKSETIFREYYFNKSLKRKVNLRNRTLENNFGVTHRSVSLHYYL